MNLSSFKGPNYHLIEQKETEATILLRKLQVQQDVYEHCSRVANFGVEIAKELKLSLQEQVQVGIVGLFHDIGKLSLPTYLFKEEFHWYQES